MTDSKPLTCFNKAPELFEKSLQIDFMLKMIYECKEIVDSGLIKAAYWSGNFRREIVDRGEKQEIKKLKDSFNYLVDQANDNKLPKQITLNFIKYLHDRSVGGREIRKTTLRVGNEHNFPKPHLLESLLNEFIEKNYTQKEDPVFKALRVHVDIVAIHPFTDGNGRTSRLLAKYILLKAGFRSTLFTAIDQHFRNEMDKYIIAVREHQYKRITIEQCVGELMKGMLNNVIMISWLRNRKQKILGLLISNFHIDKKTAYQIMNEFDFKNLKDIKYSILKKENISPLNNIISSMSVYQKEALNFQLSRLLHEEEAQKRQSN